MKSRGRARPGQLGFFIIQDPQRGDLARYRLDLLGSVIVSHTNEYAEPLPFNSANSSPSTETDAPSTLDYSLYVYFQSPQRGQRYFHSRTRPEVLGYLNALTSSSRKLDTDLSHAI